MTVPQVVREVKKLKNKNVTITGGEPLYQENFSGLAYALLERDYNITLETNGSLIIPQVLRGYLHIVIDYKTPSSGMTSEMDMLAFRDLKEDDFVKFVVADKVDLESAIKARKMILKEYETGKMIPPRFAFSPMFKENRPAFSVQEILDYLREKKVYDAVINVQIHKVLGVA